MTRAQSRRENDGACLTVRCYNGRQHAEPELESAMSTAPSQKSSPKPAQVLKDSEFNWEDPLDLEGELSSE